MLSQQTAEQPLELGDSTSDGESSASCAFYIDVDGEQQAMNPLRSNRDHQDPIHVTMFRICSHVWDLGVLPHMNRLSSMVWDCKAGHCVCARVDKLGNPRRIIRSPPWHAFRPFDSFPSAFPPFNTRLHVMLSSWPVSQSDVTWKGGHLKV